VKLLQPLQLFRPEEAPYFGMETWVGAREGSRCPFPVQGLGRRFLNDNVCALFAFWFAKTYVAFQFQ